jgi:hypothetical protein
MLAGISILVASPPAQAIQPKDASYFCVTEMAGGLVFDETLKRWRGASLRTDDKFILKLKFLGMKMGKDFVGKDEMVLSFNVSVTPSGSNSPSECRSRADWGDVIEVRANNYLLCNAVLSDYTINFANNRFLSNYMSGYVDGANDNKNTPAVTGGTCTKIN